jgi:NADPH:quinone reductase-like Zn-dependent oxidoreductase
MRAAGIRALGEPVEILEVDELAPPGADEVLIDVAAAGVGNWDELVRIGSWRIGGPVPMALGTEAAGTVAAAGSGVAEVGEGDEVITHPLPLRRHGTWAGRVLAPAATVAPRPPEALWEAGGAFPVPAREITGGGAPKAVNAARGQAATTLKAVADGGRLATITGDPPREERGVAVSDVYVRPDGRQLSALAELLARGALSVPIASVRPLEQAAQALREVVAGADGAVVLSLRA